jgi:hypothetical protein
LEIADSQNGALATSPPVASVLKAKFKFAKSYQKINFFNSHLYSIPNVNFVCLLMIEQIPLKIFIN